MKKTYAHLPLSTIAHCFMLSNLFLFSPLEEDETHLTWSVGLISLLQLGGSTTLFIYTVYIYLSANQRMSLLQKDQDSKRKEHIYIYICRWYRSQFQSHLFLFRGKSRVFNNHHPLLIVGWKPWGLRPSAPLPGWEIGRFCESEIFVWNIWCV